MHLHSFIFTLITGIPGSLSSTALSHRLEPRQVSDNVDSSGDCSGYQLNRGTWAELGIDNYLSHYPGGQNISLHSYTTSLNVLNFDCGIGKTCLAGQLCHPVRGRDWVVLSAVQEWNFYMNSMYDAVATAMEMIQGVSAAMVADFLPDGDDKKILIELTVGLMALSGVVVLGFVAALLVPILWAVLVTTWDWVAWGTTMTGSGIASAWVWLTTLGGESTLAAAEASEIAATEATTAASNEAAEVGALKFEEAALTSTNKLQKRSPKHHRTITHDKFELWSALDTNLRQLEDRLQSLISVTSKLALHSPISSQDGLYGVLQNGTFLSDHPPKATLVDNARETVQLGTLAQLFRIMNVILVIDPAPCKQEGPTTPLKHPEAVHFCSTDGVKTSLAMVREKKIDYEIRNGRLLFSKYGYSTEFLYQLASDCQIQRQNQNLNGTANGNPLTMANKGSGFLQHLTNNSTTTGSMANVDLPDPHNNGTLSSAMNTDSKSSTILLPDGSSICSFPIPICDLRQPEIKTRISGGESPAKVCKDVLQLPDVYI